MYNVYMKIFAINLLFGLLAVASIIFCSIAMYKIRQLKLKYKAAIILIPLYHRKIWYIFSLVLLAILLFLSILFIAITKMYVIFCSIIISISMIIALLIRMMTCRFAVLDCGIVSPFRYIDWLHLYEYKIENNKVFFYKDEEGYDTINAISPKLSFDKANLNKLEFLLNKHRVKIK